MIGPMRRRDLLLALPALAAAKAGKLPITAIEIWRFEGKRQAETGVNGQGQVNPLHVYDDLRPKPYRDGIPGTREAPP